jgi:hypothetical protein
LTDAEILASTAFGASLAYTLASTVVLGSSVVYKDTNASLMSLMLSGGASGTTPLDIRFTVPTPVAGTTYQQFMSLGYNSGSTISGGVWSGGVVSGTSAFASCSVLYSGTRKEGIRCLTQNGTTVFTGINNSSPTNTLDVINTTTTAGILSLRNNSGVQVCSVSNTGLLTLTATGTATVLSIAGTAYTADSVTNTLSLTPSRTSITLTATGTATALTLAGTAYTADTIAGALSLTPSRTSVTLTATGAATALTVAGTTYSSDTMKAALGITATPTFTGNITLPSTYTAPTATQLGYTVTITLNTVALTGDGKAQNVCGTTGVDRFITVSVGGSYIVTWNYYVASPSSPLVASSMYISTIAPGTASADGPKLYFPPGDTTMKQGVLTRLYTGPACTFYPVCMMPLNASITFTNGLTMTAMRIA